ncbi:MFS-type transporter 1 [Dissostichus eleginoides]|uniref:MFS-type transporter 1 n=1 Tax=Dissostichus eleginoides TaxID=100907 RepID=A0AAD9BEW7_DISEL|nr:MFS-type transporter 1 [Dissostichus eleginoides]
MWSCRSWQDPMPAVWTPGSACPPGPSGHNVLPHSRIAMRTDCHLIKISLCCHEAAHCQHLGYSVHRE